MTRWAANRTPDPSVFGLGPRTRRLAKPEEIERHVPGITFASLIQQRRQEMGLTLDEVAEASGLVKTTIWEICAARQRRPTVSMVARLATALSLPRDYMFGVACRDLGL